MENSRSGATPRMRRPEVRRRVIEAAAKVFGEKGIDAARLDDVAAEAGFTRGAVYSNFSGKDDLIAELITDRLSDVTAEGLAELIAGSPADGTGRRAGELLAEHIDADLSGRLLILEFLVRAARKPETREHFVSARRQQRAWVAEHIAERARVHGVDLPLPAEEFALVVAALINGLAVERLADPEGVSMVALPDVLALLWPEPSDGVSTGAGT